VEELNKVINAEAISEADGKFTPEVFDGTYLDMEVALPHGEPDPEFARVTKRLQDANGLPIGIANENPILDTHMYEVEHADGVKASMTASLIAQNMFTQVNEDGHRYVPFQEIVDYWSSDQAIKEADAFIATRCGTKQGRETTQGWDLLVQWKDGSTTCMALKNMKNSYPIQTAEFDMLNRINGEPAIAWWVSYVLKKRNHIIAKIKSK
jgi:hypothetical protein